MLRKFITVCVIANIFIESFVIPFRVYAEENNDIEESANGEVLNRDIEISEDEVSILDYKTAEIEENVQKSNEYSDSINSIMVNSESINSYTQYAFSDTDYYLSYEEKYGINFYDFILNGYLYFDDAWILDQTGKHRPDWDIFNRAVELCVAVDEELNDAEWFGIIFGENFGKGIKDIAKQVGETIYNKIKGESKYLECLDNNVYKLVKDIAEDGDYLMPTLVKNLNDFKDDTLKNLHLKNIYDDYKKYEFDELVKENNPAKIEDFLQEFTDSYFNTVVASKDLENSLFAGSKKFKRILDKDMKYFSKMDDVNCIYNLSGYLKILAKDTLIYLTYADVFNSLEKSLEMDTSLKIGIQRWTEKSELNWEGVIDETIEESFKNALEQGLENSYLDEIIEESSFVSTFNTAKKLINASKKIFKLIYEKTSGNTIPTSDNKINLIINQGLFYALDAEIMNKQLEMLRTMKTGNYDEESMLEFMEEYKFLYNAYIKSAMLMIESALKLTNNDYYKEGLETINVFLENYSFDDYLDIVIKEYLNSAPGSTTVSDYTYNIPLKEFVLKAGEKLIITGTKNGDDYTYNYSVESNSAKYRTPFILQNEILDILVMHEYSVLEFVGDFDDYCVPNLKIGNAFYGTTINTEKANGNIFIGNLYLKDKVFVNGNLSINNLTNTYNGSINMQGSSLYIDNAHITFNTEILNSKLNINTIDSDFTGSSSYVQRNPNLTLTDCKGTITNITTNMHYQNLYPFTIDFERSDFEVLENVQNSGGLKMNASTLIFDKDIIGGTISNYGSKVDIKGNLEKAKAYFSGGVTNIFGNFSTQHAKDCIKNISEYTIVNIYGDFMVDGQFFSYNLPDYYHTYYLYGDLYILANRDTSYDYNVAQIVFANEEKEQTIHNYYNNLIINKTTVNTPKLNLDSPFKTTFSYIYSDIYDEIEIGNYNNSTKWIGFNYLNVNIFTQDEFETINLPSAKSSESGFKWNGKWVIESNIVNPAYIEVSGNQYGSQILEKDGKKVVSHAYCTTNTCMLTAFYDEEKQEFIYHDLVHKGYYTDAPEDPTKEGYVFLGWSYDGKNIFKCDQNKIYVNHIFTALWREDKPDAPDRPNKTMTVSCKENVVNDIPLPDNWQWIESDRYKTVTFEETAYATAEYIGVDKDIYTNLTQDVTIFKTSHYWEYVQEADNLLVAYCLNESCDNNINNKVVSKLDVPDSVYSGKSIIYEFDDRVGMITGYPSGYVTYEGINGTVYGPSYQIPYKVGEYQASISVRGYLLKDTFKIAPVVKVKKPKADTTVFVYDGHQKTYYIENNQYYTVIDNTRTDAGTQYVTVSLNGTDGIGWDDGSVGDLKYEFNILKASNSSIPKLTSINESISGKSDGSIMGCDETMEYRREGESIYTSITASEVINLSSGNYYFRYKETNNYKASNDVQIKIAEGSKINVIVDEVVSGCSIIIDNGQARWHDSVKIEVVPESGFSITDNYAILINDVVVETDNLFYTIDEIERDSVISVIGIEDIMAPTGTISIKENIWKTFINSITFNLFYKDNVDITINSEDVGSGIKEIYYYLCSEAKSLIDLKNNEDWLVYKTSISVEEDNKYIVYAKIVDNSGNETYISSDGLVIDKTMPLIPDLNDNETYYGDLLFNVSDNNIDYVSIDGTVVEKTVEGKYFIEADNNRHFIEAFDKAGNRNSISVVVFKMYNVKFFADGVLVSEQAVGYGKDAVLPTIPAKEGHTQKEPVWNSDGKNITSDIAVTATYYPDVYNIYLPDNQIGYSLSTDNLKVSYMDNIVLHFSLDDGYSITDKFEVRANGNLLVLENDNTIAVKNIKEDIVLSVIGVDDISEPVGTITVKENVWRSFLNTITFGLFFNNDIAVDIEGFDSGSGIQSISYIISDTILTKDDLENIKEWKEFGSTVYVSDEKQFVIYAKLLDNRGNKSYISSDGLTIDKTVPGIIGIENSCSYYGDISFKVVEDNIGSVNIDGMLVKPDASGLYTVKADNRQHSIEIIDKAGNNNSISIIVYKMYTVSFVADSRVIDEQTVGYGKNAILPVIPAKEGYTQKQPIWNKDGKNITSDMTINAVYYPDIYKLILPETQLGYTVEYDKQSVLYGGDITFKINIDETYIKTDDYKVLINGKVQNETEKDTYVLTNITCNQLLEVKGLTHIEDSIPPAIIGIKNNLSYCEKVSFAIRDENLSNVFINGVEHSIREQYEIAAQNDREYYKIEAVDTYGNSTIVNIVLFKNHSYESEEVIENSDGTKTIIRKCANDCGSKYQLLLKNDEIIEEIYPSDGTLKTQIVSNDELEVGSVKGLSIDTVKHLLNQDELESVFDGNNISISLKIISVDRDTVKYEDMSEINKSGIMNSLSFGNYMDISFYKNNGISEEQIESAELASKLLITIRVPENIVSPENIEREYFVLRIHNGKVDIIPATYDNGFITFETNLFSTYSIWYKDVSRTVNGVQLKPVVNTFAA